MVREKDYVWICFIFLLCSLFFPINFVSAEVIINEAELNPTGTDAGNEWIELYSSNFANLSGYKLMNFDNDTLDLNIAFSGYYVYTFSSGWLDNEDEKVVLMDINNNSVSATTILSDSYNDDRTWQYCNTNWLFAANTKNLSNNCQQNQSQEDQTETTLNDSIYIELNWVNSEIINDEQFEIEILAYNLKGDDYDVKVWIEFKDSDTVISEVYDDVDDVWGSGNYYIGDVFSGSGNKTEKLKIKLKQEYQNFSGTTDIYARIRTGDDVLYSYDDSIKIRESEAATSSINNNYQYEEDIEENETVIKLASKKEFGKNDGILYKSKNEYIKEYALYAFIVFCLALVGYFAFKKIGKRKNEIGRIGKK